ncbi:MAG: hypothetical protein AB7I27_19180 [Bacteriovoracaceae bacterium]
MKKHLSILLLTSTLFSCNGQNENSKNPDRFLNGVDLDASQEQIVKKYTDGFSKCRPSDDKTACFWEGNKGPIQMLYFVNSQIESGTISVDRSTLSELIKHLKNKNITFKLEPIQSGAPVDEATLEAIKYGALKVLDGADKVKMGDYLSFGCKVIYPYHKGRVEYMGLKKDYQLRECSLEVIGGLEVDSVLYYNKPNREG